MTIQFASYGQMAAYLKLLVIEEGGPEGLLTDIAAELDRIDRMWVSPKFAVAVAVNPEDVRDHIVNQNFDDLHPITEEDEMDILRFVDENPELTKMLANSLSNTISAAEIWIRYEWDDVILGFLQKNREYTEMRKLYDIDEVEEGADNE